MEEDELPPGYDPDDYQDEATNSTINRTNSALNQAKQQEYAPRTENGATTESGVKSVENKLYGGINNTLTALHLLGAGQPYKSGDY